MLRGHNSAKWQHKFKIYDKVNTYILYTTKTKPIKPLRYEMMGYDTLLSSYYDHYVLDYEMFEPWDFNYTTLQIPTGRVYGQESNMCDVLLWFKEKNANSYSIEFKTQRFDIHIHIYIIQLTQRPQKFKKII